MQPAATPCPDEPAPTATPRGLTAVEGLKVGHATMPDRPTGCTVILAGDGAVASVDVRGGAPATKETDLLDPVNLVPAIHAVVLSGGSAFGLDCASGVMRFLEERDIGFDTRVARVPLVPAASLFDLAFGGDARIRPDADCGYRAAQAATDDPVVEGNVGAGAGATVGKVAGIERAMKGGLGSTSIALPDGLVVAALVAVNAFGDVIDPTTGRVVAGVRTADGRALADARRLLRGATGSGVTGPRPGRSATEGAATEGEGAEGSGGAVADDAGRFGPSMTAPRTGENTTIGVVATNATLTKTQARKLAQMAQDGLARAIDPVHTPYDGDAVFALATGRHQGPIDLFRLGALAAEVMAEAIVRAARSATSLGGLPAARDLAP